MVSWYNAKINSYTTTMKNRLPAMLMALAVTLFSFGQSAFDNTAHTIAGVTEKVFGHEDDMVILAEEDKDEADKDYEEDHLEEEVYYEEDHSYEDKEPEEENYSEEDRDEGSSGDHFDEQAEKIEEMIGELDRMLWDLEDFILEAKSNLNDEQPLAVTDSLHALEKLLEGGFDLLDTMLSKTKDGLTEEEAYEFWDMLDYMWVTSEKHIMVIKESLRIEGEVYAHEDEDYDDKYFEDYYGGDYDYDEFLNGFDYEETEEVTRYISEDLMHELAEHADNPYAQKLLMSVMNNLDVLDSEVIDYLSYTAELFDVMEGVDVPDEDDAKYDDLKRLYEASFVLLTEDARDDLLAAWIEVRSAVEQGADKETLSALESEIEALLKSNKDTLVLKEGVGFYDVDLADDEWYFDDVQTLSTQGVIGGDKDSNGNSTGYYRPADAITKGEMLKLILEVSGRGESSATPSDSSAINQWYEGYVAQFENMSMSYGGNWNEPVTRREAAVWISEALELHKMVAAYNNEFGDVSSSDADALHFVAVYEFGIFTGDSGTGNLRPDDGMNRAEAAKAIRVAMEEVLDGSASTVDETLDAFLEEYRD